MYPFMLNKPLKVQIGDIQNQKRVWGYSVLFSLKEICLLKKKKTLWIMLQVNDAFNFEKHYNWGLLVSITLSISDVYISN